VARIVAPRERVILDETLEGGVHGFADGQTIQLCRPVRGYIALFVDRQHFEEGYYSHV
jgi:hypothetical protein